MRIIAYLLIVIIAIAMCILIGSCSPDSKIPEQATRKSLRNENDSLHIVLERLSHENGYLQGYYRGRRGDDIKIFTTIIAICFLCIITRYIGCFIDEKKAAMAYNEKAKEFHGEFANLNIL
jgi:hypothetical protein